MWSKTSKTSSTMGEIWQMWPITVNFAAIKLVFLSHFAQNKYLLTRIMKPADHLGWNQIFTITFLSFSPPHNLWIIHMYKKTKYIKGLLWQHLVCLQKMPVTGTRHNSHNPSSELTASPFAFQKPPNYVFSPVTPETLWRTITFYGPQAISVAHAQNWGVPVIFIHSGSKTTHSCLDQNDPSG